MTTQCNFTTSIKDLKQKKCNFFAFITLDTIQTRWNCEKQLVGF